MSIYLIKSIYGRLTACKDAFYRDGYINFTLFNGTNDRSQVWDIYSIEKADGRGGFADVSADMIPDHARIKSSISANYPDLTFELDSLIKRVLILNWGDNGFFELYLENFLPCSKSDLLKVIDMIGKFSADISGDLDKIRYTIDYVYGYSTNQIKRGLDKCREYLYNSKLYISHFGNTAAEDITQMTLDDLFAKSKTLPDTKKRFFALSRALLLHKSYSQMWTVYHIYKYFKSMLNMYFKNTYPWLTAGYLQNAEIFLVNDRGTVVNVFKVVKLPASADDIDNTVISMTKPQKRMIIDNIFDEINSIDDIIRKINEDPAADISPIAYINAPAAADTAPAENVVEPSEAVAPAADTAPAENAVESSEAVTPAADTAQDMPAQDIPPADDMPAAAAADTAAQNPAAPDVSIVYMPPLFGICSYYADTGHLNGLLLVWYVMPPAALMSAHGRPCCIMPAPDILHAYRRRHEHGRPLQIPRFGYARRYDRPILASWTRSRISLQGDRREGYRPPGIPPHIKLYPAAESVRPRPPNIKI